MRLSLLPDDLTRYIARQVSNVFPDREVAASEYAPFIREAHERLEHCFAGLRSRYFAVGDAAEFNHRNTDHYAIFLYLLANTAFRRAGNPELAAKAYALNKALHGLDVYYEVELPPVFGFQHPVGTVLGRASYGNYFFAYQRCSVGAKDGVYPKLGEGVLMYGGSSIIGDCTIGNNVLLSANALVMGENIPGNSTVFGESPKLTIKPTHRDVFEMVFRRA